MAGWCVRCEGHLLKGLTYQTENRLCPGPVGRGAGPLMVPEWSTKGEGGVLFPFL